MQIKLKISRRKLLKFLITYILIVSFTIFYTDFIRADSIITEEEKFSNRVVNLLQPLILKNKDVNLEIDNIGRSILKANNIIDSKKINYNFNVIVDPLVNSFSTPSGDIFISTELLKAITNRDELAAVLAREIALIQIDGFIRGVKGQDNVQTWVNMASLCLFSISIYFSIGPTIENLDKDNEGGISSIVAPSLFLVLAEIPPLLLQKSRKGRVKDAMVAGELMKGRNSRLSKFDAKLLKLIYEGYDSDIELEADKLSIVLLKDTDFNPYSLVDVLERIHLSGGSKRSHLLSAQPGLAVRLTELDVGYEREKPKKSEKSDIWEDFD